MKGTITVGEFNGMRMLRFSQLSKTGDRTKERYVLSQKDTNAIRRDIARCESKMNKSLDETVAMIKKLKQRSDRVEMYEFAIATAKQEIKNLKERKREISTMFPFPIAERNRQVADCVISHHESSIVRFKQEMAAK